MSSNHLNLALELKYYLTLKGYKNHYHNIQKNYHLVLLYIFLIQHLIVLNHLMMDFLLIHLNQIGFLRMILLKNLYV